MPSAARRTRRGPSVRLREPRLRGRRTSAFHAHALPVGAAEWNVAQRRLRLGLDLRFAVRAAAPAGDNEPGTPFHRALELLVRTHARRMLVTEGDRALQQRRLDLVQLRGD